MIDSTTIEIFAGQGGRGAVAFRREKFVPRGGPAGGDGGRGGNVYLVTDSSTNTLVAFRYNRLFKAEHGKMGEGGRRSGRSGTDLEIPVPVGTEVWVESETNGESQLIGDLNAESQKLLVASAGSGGRGNARFVTSTLREPMLAEEGEAGESTTLRLELKLLADVGIVGLPNAGKSSLIAALSRARPKIANYPFTTLEPVLGVVERQLRSLVAVDIPGLIEGAHTGTGLGHEFLRHIERTRILVHLVDGIENDIAERIRIINNELSEFDESLANKPQILAVNKLDHPDVQDLREEIESEIKAEFSGETPVFFVSALGHLGLEELELAMFAELDAALQDDSTRRTRSGGASEITEIPVLRPAVPKEIAAIIRIEDGFRVTHARAIRLANASDLTNWKTQVQMRDQLERLGITKQLGVLGISSGDKVFLGEWEFEWE